MILYYCGQDLVKAKFDKMAPRGTAGKAQAEADQDEEAETTGEALLESHTHISGITPQLLRNLFDKLG